ncbi:hypothetical protein JVX88_07095 [Leptolyngbya sp. 7M]|nr:hypothetical protein [Leptolyngbya sp. 7M]QYO68926.1 hypothetical protein JVX88_07095 [Leptolyngbya sp. 7M]
MEIRSVYRVVICYGCSDPSGSDDPDTIIAAKSKYLFEMFPEFIDRVSNPARPEFTETRQVFSNLCGI